MNRQTAAAMLNQMYKIARELSGENDPRIDLAILLNNGESYNTEYHNIRCEELVMSAVHPDTWQVVVVPYVSITGIKTVD